ncbi:MFS transporter [Peribacillus butanolivorans]|uniref:MFS transporter n=1 Tax=Peribacillus butanolivorans TaxID=421767 RepID=UPI003671B172
MIMKDGNLNRKLKPGNMIAYGAGDFFGGGCYAIIGLWLMYFYTTYAGLTAVEAGTILGVARIVDAFNDPVMGYITDIFNRTKLGKRFGRRGFFFLFGGPAMIIYALLWVSGFDFWFYLFTYIAFDFIYTMVIVPYETLAAEMTTDYKVRSKLTSIRMLFSTGAGIFAAWLPGRLIEFFGEDSPLSFLYMGIIFAVLFSIVILGLYFFTWERPVAIKETDTKFNFIVDMKKLFLELYSTMRIRTFRQHVGMYTGGFVANDVLGTVFTFFIVFALSQTPVFASNTLTAMSIIQFCFIPVFTYLCIKIGNGPSYRIAQVFFILGVLGMCGLYYFDMSSSIYLIYGAAALIGVAKSGTFYVCWNIYSFMADVDEVLTGERREGIFAGVMTFVRKCVQAAAIFFVGLMLENFGFVSGENTQSATAVDGIISVFLVGTIVFLLFGLYVNEI